MMDGKMYLLGDSDILEREKTADLRFVAFDFSRLNDRPGKYQFSVCDRNAQPQTIAKFRSARDAELFVEARRLHYIKTGE